MKESPHFSESAINQMWKQIGEKNNLVK